MKNLQYERICKTLTRKGWLHAHFFSEAVENEEVEVVGNYYENPELLK